MSWRALDLFCGAGGATRGLQLAGFHVTGVDIRPQPRYVGDAFHPADALEFPLDGFNFVWASPPCQAHTQMSNRWRGKGGKADSHPDLIAPVRERLLAWGGPWVIENVVGAPLRAPLVLTGAMFGLGVHRPRLFESNVLLLSPTNPGPPAGVIGVYGERHDGRLLMRRVDGSELRAPRTLEQAGEAMGVHWMEWRELAESIPPAYAQYIGRQVIAALEAAA